MRRYIVLILVLVVTLGSYFFYQNSHAKYHIHADFAMFIDGSQFDFTKPYYMTSTDSCSTDYNSKHTHLHDENGMVIHIHEKDQTVSDFFTSIGFTLTDELLDTKSGITYKNNEDKKWQFFINGVATSSLQNYIIQDIDKLLLSYGRSAQQNTQTEQEKVTNNACIYSQKCPVPAEVVLPTENCGNNE